MWPMNYGWWGMGLVWLALLVVAALVVWAVLRLGRETGASAEELLLRRFAGGEIDEAEYLRRLMILRGKRSEANR